MGYNTTFHIDIEANPDGEDVEYIFFRFCKEFGYPFEFPNESLEGKYYDLPVHLEEFSVRFPNVIFKLKGEGEEPGDLWVRYVKDGKTQLSQAMITYEPCRL